MPQERVVIGPVELVAENLGFEEYRDVPRITGYIQGRLAWTLSFRPDLAGLKEALKVWFTHQLAESFADQQRDAVAKLSEQIRSLVEAFETEAQSLRAKAGAEQRVQQLGELAGTLREHANLYSAAPQAGDASETSVSTSPGPPQDAAPLALPQEDQGRGTTEQVEPPATRSEEAPTAPTSVEGGLGTVEDHVDELPKTEGTP